MARKRNDELARLLKEHNIKTVSDIENLVRDLTSDLLQEALDAEL